MYVCLRKSLNEKSKAHTGTIIIDLMDSSVMFTLFTSMSNNILLTPTVSCTLCVEENVSWCAPLSRCHFLHFARRRYVETSRSIYNLNEKKMKIDVANEKK